MFFFLFVFLNQLFLTDWCWWYCITWAWTIPVWAACSSFGWPDFSVGAWRRTPCRKNCSCCACVFSNQLPTILKIRNISRTWPHRFLLGTLRISLSTDRPKLVSLLKRLLSNCKIPLDSKWFNEWIKYEKEKEERKKEKVGRKRMREDEKRKIYKKIIDIRLRRLLNKYFFVMIDIYHGKR